MRVRQDRLGHVDPKTTLQYTHSISADERALVGYGAFSNRAKWRALRSARIRTLKKHLTPPTLSSRWESLEEEEPRWGGKTS